MQFREYKNGGKNLSKVYRNELKFVVDEATLQLMKQKLQPLLLYDSHQVEDSYRIRSMYFDTYRESLTVKMMRA